jgi:DNA invertase Pin-like site-specific DNA recombinase
MHDRNKVIPVAIFVRVSRQDQNYNRQVSELQEYANQMNYIVVSVISEKISGAKRNTERKGIDELLQLSCNRKISKVLVSEVSRLGRDARETNNLLSELTDLRVSIYTRNFNLETLDAHGKRNPIASLIFGIIKELAEYERELLWERINSGLDEARRKGKKLGRPTGTTQQAKDLLATYPGIVKDLKEGLSIRKTAAFRKVSVDTVQRVKKVLIPS